ncbi:hypothetical protein [Hymenobacter rubripertinctus]|uniref:Uncharacterized protein n=1 Tax=Hymenobacter rubripertinctus TaxID=2029981 RepID=A0A418QP97_9BACT|nr:hypothetical protein [Hymenobacter rubripertinctus]RIY06952.1 hypothetical protein D0T11_17680 [Hymenobacter rubripertinctus]
MLALPISSTDRYGQTTVADEAVSPPLGGAVLAGTVVDFIAHAPKFNKAHLVYFRGQPFRQSDLPARSPAPATGAGAAAASTIEPVREQSACYERACKQ